MNGRRLASVLRVRELQERAARGALGASRHAHRRAELAERTTWQMLDEGPASITSTNVRGVQLLVAAGMLAAETQRATTVAAADAVVSATDEWTIAARRVEGLERLVERQRGAATEEAARVAANEIDDLVLIRFAGGASQ